MGLRSGFGLKPEEVDDWVGELLEATRPHRQAIKRELAAEMRAKKAGVYAAEVGGRAEERASA